MIVGDDVKADENKLSIPIEMKLAGDVHTMLSDILKAGRCKNCSSI